MPNQTLGCAPGASTAPQVAGLGAVQARRQVEGRGEGRVSARKWLQEAFLAGSRGCFILTKKDILAVLVYKYMRLMDEMAG